MLHTEAEGPCKINLRTRVSNSHGTIRCLGVQTHTKSRVSINKKLKLGVTELTGTIDCRHDTITCALFNTSVRPFGCRDSEEMSFNIQGVSEHK